MGSIDCIWKPENWKKVLEGKSKVLADDVIYKMIIGIGEDLETYEIIEFISKLNYENILNGTYSVKIFPYSEIPILLFNEKQLPIPLVRGAEYPLDKLSRIQRIEIEHNHPKIYLYK